METVQTISKFVWFNLPIQISQGSKYREVERLFWIHSNSQWYGPKINQTVSGYFCNNGILGDMRENIVLLLMSL